MHYLYCVNVAIWLPDVVVLRRHPTQHVVVRMANLI
jgi:hypothetical protein